MVFIDTFLETFFAFLGMDCFRLPVALCCFVCGWFVFSEIVGYMLGVSENDN